MDIKSFFGLNGSSFTNIKNSLLDLANVLENQIIPKLQRVEKSVNNIAKSAASITGGVGSGNKIAENGAPVAQGAGGGDGGVNTGGNRVADNGSFATRAVGAGMYGMNLLQNAMPGVPTSVQQDFLTNRAAFYGVAGFGGSLQGRTDQINALQRQLASQGTLLNNMDAINTIIAAQNSGLGGARNFSSQGGVLSGIATLSNLMPGLGGAGPNGTSGAASVAATFNAPTTVNMARAMGINIRQANGDILGVDKIIDQLWSYFNKPGMPMLTADQIKESYMPGRYFYETLNSLLNGDPVAMQSVYVGFLAKAQTGGKTPLGNLSKSTLQGLGVSTATTNAIGRNVAAQTNLLTTTAAATAGGFAGAQNLGVIANNAAASLGALAQALGAANGAYTGVSALGGGTGGKIINTLLGLIGLRAEGGPVGNKMPYIVGEKGPELFVPKTDGTIIPNHKLGLNRDMGGGVSAGGATGYTQEDFAKAVIRGLGGTPTPQNVANMIMWENKEGGNWKNTAKFNPLNTSYQESGSTNFNTGMAGSGVQSYMSWQQGVDATIRTLTGKDAGPRGYTNIVKSLTGGKTSNEDFFKLMQASSWDAGHYGGPGGTSSSGVMSSSSKYTSSAARLASEAALKNSTQSAQSAIGVSASGSGSSAPSSSTVNYNYGGVTIAISGAGKDAKQLADDIKSALLKKTASN
jgi:hypothetical protein